MYRDRLYHDVRASTNPDSMHPTSSRLIHPRSHILIRFITEVGLDLALSTFPSHTHDQLCRTVLKGFVDEDFDSTSGNNSCDYQRRLYIDTNVLAHCDIPSSDIGPLFQYSGQHPPKYDRKVTKVRYRVGCPLRGTSGEPGKDIARHALPGGLFPVGPSLRPIMGHERRYGVRAEEHRMDRQLKNPARTGASAALSRRCRN